MAKYAAFGTLLKRAGTTIAQVQSISGPSIQVDTEDVTTHDQATPWEEIIPTLIRTGELTLDLVYDPNGATHKNASGGLLYDLVNRASTAYTLVFPSTPAVTWSFNAYVVGFEPSAPHDGALTASVTMKPLPITTA